LRKNICEKKALKIFPINEDFIAIGRNEHKYANHKFIEDLCKYMEDVKAG
jgi:hypothetical protein